jgi:hypothetical protein
MPLATPKDGESRKDFIARFMREHKGEFKNQEQRLAVAYAQWRKHLSNKRKARHSMRVLKNDHLAVAGRKIMGGNLFDYMFPLTSWMLTTLPAMASGAVLQEEVERTNPWFAHPTALSDNVFYDILYNPERHLPGAFDKDGPAWFRR